MTQRGRKAIKAKSIDVLPRHQRTWLLQAAVVGLLAWYFISAVTATVGKSVAFDELLHLTGGYSYWKFGDFRMQPTNGNLPQRWAAIPLLFRNTHFPDLDQDAWRLSASGTMGDQFFHSVANDADAMLLRGRAMTALFGVALGALVFFWARSLLGPGSALVSVGLYAFCPTMLANGALVTSDMATALFFSASMLCIWRVLHLVNWRTLLVGSLVMAALFLSKFSAFMLVPMGLVLVAIQLISRQPTAITFGRTTWEVRDRLGRLAVHLASIVVHAIVVWIVIWMFYDFRYDMFARKSVQIGKVGEMEVLDQPTVPWDLIVQDSGPVVQLADRMRGTHLLPEAYLYGLAHTWRLAQQRCAFLNGRYSLVGWPQFFPYCLLVKTSLTLFVLMSFSAAWVISSWFRAGQNWRARADAMLGSLYRTAPLWTLFVVYWAFAIPSHLNIGHRHILPTYPVMLIFAGGSWLWLASKSNTSISERDGPHEGVARRSTRWLITRRWPISACIVTVSIALFAGESLSCWPNYLAYFNQVVGRPWYAYRHLVDSSLDWGQDLPALQRWLVKQGLDGSPNEKTYLSYFGSGRPSYYGIKATLLPCFYDYYTEPRIPEPLEAGTYCISATMLQSVYSPYYGRWNRQYEVAYQQLAEDFRRFSQSNSEERDRQMSGSERATRIQLLSLYDKARFARLVSFLRQREPDFEINNTILIYRLQAWDLNLALNGPAMELDESPFVDIEPK
jgi:hypothetical protein